MRAHARKTYVNSPSSLPIIAVVQKWGLLNRKRFVFPNLQMQHQLLLCHMCSGGHLNGHVNTHIACLWSLENPHEVLESQRDSPKLNGYFVPYLSGECVGLSFSENQLQLVLPILMLYNYGYFLN
ncbi:hypothetical protein TNCV_1757381 [Trichonephila clavipes]|nr:hypothetical protein TNCV_1757381 [Trichonephila clavipes]